jgi:hypothetical protein
MPDAIPESERRAMLALVTIALRKIQVEILSVGLGNTLFLRWAGRCRES